MQDAGADDAIVPPPAGVTCRGHLPSSAAPNKGARRGERRRDPGHNGVPVLVEREEPSRRSLCVIVADGRSGAWS